jgi:hypothetical protein
MGNYDNVVLSAVRTRVTMNTMSSVRCLYMTFQIFILLLAMYCMNFIDLYYNYNIGIDDLRFVVYNFAMSTIPCLYFVFIFHKMKTYNNSEFDILLSLYQVLLVFYLIDCGYKISLFVSMVIDSAYRTQDLVLFFIVVILAYMCIRVIFEVNKGKEYLSRVLR